MEKRYRKTTLAHEGKTKKIWNVADMPRFVIVENKGDITAHDNPSLTRRFGTKAQCATQTTCRMFELLRDAGIPVAYIKQLSDTEFLAHKSTMVPLEVVGRRLAVGSFLRRCPHMIPKYPTKPHRFHRLFTEFFLKTTGRAWGDLSLPCDDPLILNPDDEEWQLALPKNPIWEETQGDKDDHTKTSLIAKVAAETALSKVTRLGFPDSMESMRRTLRRVCYVLEKAWAMLGLTFVDIKIEFDSELRVSDVVDNDSWRLWLNGKQLDKQVFRDGGEAALAEVEENYQLVAALSERVRIPNQALVLWRGSSSDEYPDINERIKAITTFTGQCSVKVVEVTVSGHKQSRRCADIVDQIERNFPGGGVIIAEAGMSNGLGPTVSARTNWPVISFSPSVDDHPEDVWSSLRMPSAVPNMTVISGKRAVDAAFRILSQNNPVVYALEREQIEALDE